MRKDIHLKCIWFFKIFHCIIWLLPTQEALNTIAVQTPSSRVDVQGIELVTSVPKSKMLTTRPGTHLKCLMTLFSPAYYDRQHISISARYSSLVKEGAKYTLKLCREWTKKLNFQVHLTYLKCLLLFPKFLLSLS